MVTQAAPKAPQREKAVPFRALSLIRPVRSQAVAKEDLGVGLHVLVQTHPIADRF
jgi:hypothetical protein